MHIDVNIVVCYIFVYIRGAMQSIASGQALFVGSKRPEVTVEPTPHPVRLGRRSNINRNIY